MTIEEARKLISSPMWPCVRDAFLASGRLEVYPAGDLRRMEYLDADTRAEIVRWEEGLRRADEWRCVVDGEQVRRLRADNPGVYPEVLRYAPYFRRHIEAAGDGVFPPEAVKLLLKMRFPEAYRMVCPSGDGENTQPKDA